MAEERAKRKMSAILSADVKGYSRLMQDDEEATVRTITAYREVMVAQISEQNGRVVDAKGDNILAEFPSVVNAVRCAVEIQRELEKRNAELPENRKMQFRIGVNLGDVIEEEDTIYGDGVNIAARLEGLADGGGICISGTAFEHTGKRLPLGYEYLGEQEVKNIEKPVRVYRVLMEPEAAGRVIGKEWPKPKKWWWAAIAAVVVLAVVAGGLIWNFYVRPDVEPASVEKMAFPLPDKPSIAVLPFVNVSGDPSQEFFSDGLTEEIITALSRIPEMFVIARNSTFSYKGKAVKVQRVAEELGVHYVLEGSCQRSGDKVRVTMQLIDALKGHNIMSERLERTMAEIFALQDDLTKSIITAVQAKLTEGSGARLHAKGTTNIEAYLMFLEARELLFRFTKDDNALARRKFEDVIALDPGYPSAFGLLSNVYIMDMVYGVSPGESMQKAIEAAKKAVVLDDTNASGHMNLGFVYSWKKEHDKAIAENERAVELEPGSAGAWFSLGRALDYAGRHEEAIDLFKKAIRMNPLGNTVCYFHLGNAYFNVGKYEEGISAHKKALEFSPTNFAAHRGLAACYAQLGRNEEATFHAKEALKFNPKFSIAQYVQQAPWKDIPLTERWANALRKAGLPETPPLPLPDKPSIAVLPFVNISDDKSQEYFSEGLTEEIITALSKIPKLFVIARNSTFVYKGKPVNVQQVSRELGVKYVLEGSVRKSGDQLRITAQLIDATTGNHLCAERYDREMKDIFAIQDEITMKIVTAMRVKLTEGDQALLLGRQAKNLDVYLKSMEWGAAWREGTREGFIRCGQLAQEIVDMAPESVLGYRNLAWYYWYLATVDKSPRESLAKAFKLAQKAIEIDKSDSSSYTLLGSIYLYMRKYEEAIAAGKKAITVNPNGALEHDLLGYTLNYAGMPDEAMDHFTLAHRLNPFPDYWYFRHLGQCYMLKGQYAQALVEYRKALHQSPDSIIINADLTVIYVLLDRLEEARAAAKKLVQLYPKFTVEGISKNLPYKNENDLKLVVDALRKAGLK